MLILIVDVFGNGYNMLWKSRSISIWRGAILKIEIREIRKRDYHKAIQFAIKGMHFDWYLNHKFLLNAYGRYFWYLEINRATQILAAYVNGEFVGVLLAEIKGEEKKQQNFLQKSYVGCIDTIQKIFLKRARAFTRMPPKNCWHTI